jgi:hypothetical protein
VASAAPAIGTGARRRARSGWRTRDPDRITRGARELVQLLAGAGTGLAATGLCVLALLSLPTSLAAGMGIVMFAGVTWLTRRLAWSVWRSALGCGWRPCNAC